MTALYLIGGFLLLLLGGEFLVRGSVGVALKLRVSKVVIGLTLVAFATSAPELLVSVVAALKGKSDIALGNVIGSNIANIGLILGVTALLFKMQAVRLEYQRDWYFLLAANFLLAVFLWLGGINQIQGLLLVLLLIFYNIQKIRSARKQRSLKIGEEIHGYQMATWKGVALIVIGALGLSFGAKVFVIGISGIALQFGMTERFVAVTMVAFGTSVPELVASLVAARKGESDIAIGNIIGSNIFNIGSVLGLTAIIKPIVVDDPLIVSRDLIWMLIFAVILLPLSLILKRNQFRKTEGFALVFIYGIFIYKVFMS